MHRDSRIDRERGLAVLSQVREMSLDQRFYLTELWDVDMYTARERASRGDLDGAIPVMREALGKMFQARQFGHVDSAAAAFVESLLRRGGEQDVAEAAATIARLAGSPGDEGMVIREIWLLRLHALLAHAHDDEAGYRESRDRYREMARTLGFEGHIAWAEAMP